jgi:uncharacterized membrane protein (DUF4010 family)
VTDDLEGALGMLVAALGGAAIGVEREWSGHATGPTARFAGVRTFTLLGGLAGVVGQLWIAGQEAPAVVLLAAAGALVLAGYVVASRHDVGGTTEVAALVVLAAGFLAGTGNLAYASGVVALTALALFEKTKLHALVKRLDDDELRAAARFAVMAVVILPLLPPGPYGPLGGIRPRELWVLVLIFSGLSFAGYIARRLVGSRYGYTATGLLGGLVSSTSVTLTFARLSTRDGKLGGPLALGAVAASSVMFVRMLVALTILHSGLAAAVLPYLVAPLVVGAVAVAIGFRRVGPEAESAGESRNPLQLRAALEMAALFQVVLVLVHLVRERFGAGGLLVSGFVLGLADVDALTVSMAKETAGGAAVTEAAPAVVLGAIANTLLKLGIAVIVGAAAFRWRVAVALLAMAVAAGASLVLLR